MSAARNSTPKGTASNAPDSLVSMQSPSSSPISAQRPAVGRRHQRTALRISAISSMYSSASLLMPAAPKMRTGRKPLTAQAANSPLPRRFSSLNSR